MRVVIVIIVVVVVVVVIRIWEPLTTSLATKGRADFSKIDLLSLDWVHHGGSDSLVL